mmetsp:Transcript_159475/g.305999  ORF Transcript_159475/g.305999 Transcript_159475/m.305999 type:complete len:140 (+) Transcript_159475:311-730(+)
MITNSGKLEPKAKPLNAVPRQRAAPPDKQRQKCAKAIMAASKQRYHVLGNRRLTRIFERLPVTKRARLWAHENIVTAVAAEGFQPLRDATIEPRLVVRKRPPDWRANALSHKMKNSGRFIISRGPPSHGDAVRVLATAV